MFTRNREKHAILKTCFHLQGKNLMPVNQRNEMKHTNRLIPKLRLIWYIYIWYVYLNFYNQNSFISSTWLIKLHIQENVFMQTNPINKIKHIRSCIQN